MLTLLRHIGPREYKFNTGCYRILDLDGARAIEWANIQSRVKIIHLGWSQRAI